MSFNAIRSERSRSIPGALTLLVALVIAGCRDSVNLVAPSPTPGLPASSVRPVNAPALTSLRPSPPPISTSCGAAAEYKLSDGARVIGKVTIINDSANFYVTYTVTSAHWWISDTRLAIKRSAAEIPQEDGRPEPWSFPDTGSHEPPLTSITHQVPLSQIAAAGGQTVYFAAMAGVVHPRDESNYDGAWDWMVMWGLNDVTKPSEVIYPYVVNPCAGTGGGGGGGETPPAAGALITITFDDGWKTTITNAYPVIRDLGLKGNIAVNPEPIDGQWSAYMSIGDLNTLWAAGWKIVSHSVTHADLTGLSDAQLDRELKDSQAWLVRNGFGPTDVFIVPYHSWGARERTAIKKYYQRVRGYTVDQFWPERYAKMPWTQPYDLTAFEPEYAPFTTAAGRAETIARVDHAVKNGMFLDLMFHRITTERVPAFKLLMEEVAAKYKANVGTW